MSFPDKLILIMQVTSTSNKQLAEALRVDPSLISRFRKGTRSVPKGSEYFEYMGKYFANKCTPEKLKTLSEIIGSYRLNNVSTTGRIAKVIAEWLSEDNSEFQIHPYDLQRISRYFNKIDNLPDCTTNMNADKKIVAFYGTEGKKEASLMFSQLVLSHKRIDDIKLLNEGNMDWLWNDRGFAEEISTSLNQAVSKGAKITRIVPKIDNLSMVYDSVNRWTPLHSTGRVTSFYYPHIRDNIFCRTINIASGIAALFSTSFGDKNDNDITFLTTETHLIEALDRQFIEYQAFCVPATIVYDQENSPLHIRKSITDFLDCKSPSISILKGLSCLTTPRELVQGGLDVTGLENFETYCIRKFLNKISSCSYTEVFTIAPFESIIAGKEKCLSFELLQNKRIYYTPEEYQMHLQNIVYLLEKYSKYHVVLLHKSDYDCNIYINKEQNAMLIRDEPIFSVCNIEYSEMINDLWECARKKTQTKQTKSAHKLEVISELKSLIQQIDEFLNNPKVI